MPAAGRCQMWPMVVNFDFFPIRWTWGSSRCAGQLGVTQLVITPAARLGAVLPVSTEHPVSWCPGICQVSCTLGSQLGPVFAAVGGVCAAESGTQEAPTKAEVGANFW
ncbi:uncharacterized protein LOC123037897 [Drosophila rhopaloa]|uniref:Uncharacterized protein n=1 Tax=Drosophila rhopaloa TaxID=1041015 RepID=A0ABM5J8T7_DRORH|nr:uncharacterized protein LOC123037640 [Drosophila rhopaloa]XP_044316660.1 uncharacterized protein LOC123037897 [Drosophila rhopaloa]